MAVTRPSRLRKSSSSASSSPSGAAGRIVSSALGLGAAALAAASAEAATFTVTNLDDSGDGSLREAILEANANAGPDVIQFQSGVTGTINMAGGEMDILESLNLQGPGAGTVTIDAGSESRIFFVGSEVEDATLDVTISGLTLTDGSAFDGGAVKAQGLYLCYCESANDVNLTLDHVVISDSDSEYGGGVNTDDADLILQDVVISSNSSSEHGGGLFFAGEANSLTIRDSQITGNTAGSGGGATVRRVVNVTIEDSEFTGNQALDSRGGGLAIFETTGDIEILRTTISDNTADGKGGGAYLYTMDGYGTALIADSTISGNTAYEDRGGGLFLYDMDNAVVIRNTTISGNSANRGGGVYLYDADGATFDFATIVNNQAYYGAGMMADNGTVTISNSVISNNFDGADLDLDDGYADVSFSFVTSENSYSGAFNDNGGNIIGNSAPMLGPLEDNGGPTLTHLPMAGSPLIDAANPSAVVDADQRDETRPFGPAPDMGAVEVQEEVTPGDGAVLSFSIYNQGRGTSDPSEVKAIISDRNVLGTYPAGKDVDLDLTLTNPLTCVEPGCTPLLGSGEKADYTAALNFGPGVFGRHVLGAVPSNEADDNGDGSFTLPGDGSTGAVSFLPGRYLWIIADSAENAGQTLPVLTANDRQMQFLDAPSVPTFGELSELKVTFTESETAGVGSANPHVNVYFIGYSNPMVIQLGDDPFTGGAASSNDANLLTQGGNRFDTSGLGGSSGQDASQAEAQVGGYTISRVDFATGPAAGARASYTLDSIYLEAESVETAATSAHTLSRPAQKSTTSAKRPNQGKPATKAAAKAEHQSEVEGVIKSVTRTEETVTLKFRDGTSMKVPSANLQIQSGRGRAARVEAASASLSPGQRVTIKTKQKGEQKVVKVRIKGEAKDERKGQKRQNR